MKKKTDTFKNAMDQLEDFQRNISKAVALGFYIIHIQDFIKVINKSKLPSFQKTLLTNALFCPLMHIPEERLVIILEKLWEKKKCVSQKQP